MRRKLNQTVLGILIILLSLVIVLPLVQHQVVPKAKLRVSNTPNQKQFIKRLLPYAKKLEKYYGVRSSVILAQAAMASDYGNYLLAAKYHNFYGVLAKPGQHQILLRGAVYRDEKWQDETAAYRVYQSDEEATLTYMEMLRLEDQSTYTELAQASSYQNAAQILQDKLHPNQPHYADRMIALIKKYQLNQYDQVTSRS